MTITTKTKTTTFRDHASTMSSFPVLFIICFSFLNFLEISAFAQDRFALREELQIVGSSTVYPYAKLVLDAYGKRHNKPTPKIKSGGSGDGFREFCAGIGLKFPDISNASRPMKRKEWKLCKENGIQDITEVKFGYDGIGLVTSHQNMLFKDLTMMQIYKAIAEWIPQNGVMVRNPYRSWRDISPLLPDTLIQIYGPSTSHGSYGVLVKNVIEKTCKEELSYFKRMTDKQRYKKQIKKYCSRMRSDGGFNGLSIKKRRMFQMLKENKLTLFFTSYEILFSNRQKLKAISLEGVEPRIYTISDGSYPLKRPLFFYIKNAHRTFVPNMNLYVKEFMSKNAMGTFGYLTRVGLSGLSIQDLKKARYAVTIGRKIMRFPLEKINRY